MLYSTVAVPGYLGMPAFPLRHLWLSTCGDGDGIHVFCFVSPFAFHFVLSRLFFRPKESCGSFVAIVSVRAVHPRPTKGPMIHMCNARL